MCTDHKSGLKPDLPHFIQTDSLSINRKLKLVRFYIHISDCNTFNFIHHCNSLRFITLFYLGSLFVLHDSPCGAASVCVSNESEFTSKDDQAEAPFSVPQGTSPEENLVIVQSITFPI